MRLEHLLNGALNLETELIEHPVDALKINKYICPDCKEVVILKQGQIKAYHFAHKANTRCGYFENTGGESDLHYQAKYIMKHKLLKREPIVIYRQCYDCNLSEDFKIQYSESSFPEVEYRFKLDGCNNKKIADVALINIESNEKKIQYIFEIFNTSKTKEINRIGIWFEISAKNIMENSITNIKYRCLRKVDDCKNCENKRQEYHIMCIYKEEQRRLFKESQEELKLIYDESQEELKRIYDEKKSEEYSKSLELKRIRDDEKLQEYNKNIKELQIEKEIELEKNKECKCGIQFKNICSCDNPNYQVVKFTEQLFCVKKNCNKWKCRC